MSVKTLLVLSLHRYNLFYVKLEADTTPFAHSLNVLIDLNNGANYSGQFLPVLIQVSLHLGDLSIHATT